MRIYHKLQIASFTEIIIIFSVSIHLCCAIQRQTAATAHLESK